MTSVTFNISNSDYNQRTVASVFLMGRKIKLSKDSYWVWMGRIKNKTMVCRLLKKTFVPFVIVSNTRTHIPYELKVDLKPCNF